MVVSVRQLREDILGQAVGLVGPEPRLSGYRRAAWVNNDLLVRAKVLDAVLDASRPLFTGGHAGIALLLHGIDGLRPRVVGSAHVIFGAGYLVEQLGQIED